VSAAHPQNCSNPALCGPPPFSDYLETLANQRARAELAASPSPPPATRWPDRDAFEPAETRCDHRTAQERRPETPTPAERVRITHDSPAGRFFDLLV